MQSQIHEGYEYQDYFTVSIILQLMLHQTDAEIIIDRNGSGKSWLVDEYIDKLKNDDSKVIHYNCFQSLQDTNSLERIRVASLYDMGI